MYYQKLYQEDSKGESIMPYIKEKQRLPFRYLALDSKVTHPGELNYIITELIQDYIENKGLSYSTLCEVEGVLSHVSKESYRRITAIYEDTKIAENGDVFRTAKRLSQ